MYSSKFVLLICLFSFLIKSTSSIQVYNLNETEIDDLVIVDRQMAICKTTLTKKWSNLFARSYLKIDDVNAIKNIHTGYDLNEVEVKMSKWFNYNYLRLFLNSSTVNLPLYTDYCVGFESVKSYRITYHFIDFEIYSFIFFIIGTILFYSSNYLSKKIYIYYLSHVTIGVVGSLLILTIIMHRFLPKRLYAFFVLSSLYLNSYFVVKIKEYTFTHPYGLYLACYILVAAIISFCFAYYRGPIKNHRLFDLFKWFLQV